MSEIRKWGVCRWYLSSRHCDHAITWVVEVTRIGAYRSDSWALNTEVHTHWILLSMWQARCGWGVNQGETSWKTIHKKNRSWIPEKYMEFSLRINIFSFMIYFSFQHSTTSPFDFLFSPIQYISMVRWTSESTRTWRGEWVRWAHWLPTSSVMPSSWYHHHQRTSMRYRARLYRVPRGAWRYRQHTSR